MEPWRCIGSTFSHLLYQEAEAKARAEEKAKKNAEKQEQASYSSYKLGVWIMGRHRVPASPLKRSWRT